MCDNPWQEQTHQSSRTLKKKKEPNAGLPLVNDK
jgi:hypothetical protein